MSERYTLCPQCSGKNPDCLRCDGTGFDGSALVYLQKEADFQWEQDQKERQDFFQDSVNSL